MTPLLLNVLAAAVFGALLLSIWAGIHLLSQRRLGDRKLGCRGPVPDKKGNATCCHDGAPCDSADPADLNPKPLPWKRHRTGSN